MNTKKENNNVVVEAAVTKSELAAIAADHSNLTYRREVIQEKDEKVQLERNEIDKLYWKSRWAVDDAVKNIIKEGIKEHLVSFEGKVTIRYKKWLSDVEWSPVRYDEALEFYEDGHRYNVYDKVSVITVAATLGNEVAFDYICKAIHGDHDNMHPLLAAHESDTGYSAYLKKYQTIAA